jgi:hypothetical protein
MASTYSDLKIELIGTGEQAGTWGATTNTNFSVAISEAITGSADVAFSSADVTVTLTNTNAAQTARNLRLNLTGTSGGARQLILGSGCQIEKLYLINNGLADAVTVKNTTGTGISVPASSSLFVFNNGTNVVNAIDAFGGTGAVLLPVGTTAERPTGASGKIRYNSTNTKFEGYSAGAWSSIGGGATGGGADQVFVENGVTVTTNYTLTTNFNAESVGPISINSGVTVTIPANQRWVIL